MEEALWIFLIGTGAFVLKEEKQTIETVVLYTEVRINQMQCSLNANQKFVMRAPAMKEKMRNTHMTKKSPDNINVCSDEHSRKTQSI